MTLPSLDAATLKWIKNRQKQGLGSGEGAEYRPWLTVRDVPSHGDVHRPEDRHGRTMHLFSRREYWCHLILERSDAVIDVREQFPLLEIDATREIAADLGYAHPKQSRRRGGKAIRHEEPMTTDFLVTLKDLDGLPAKLAISVKTLSEIEKRPLKKQRRLLEKMQIERAYWSHLGVPFTVITDREMPEILCKNLDLILPCRSLRHYEQLSKDTEGLMAFLGDRLAAAPSQPLGTVCSATDVELNLPPGNCLVLVWHALATRAWKVDLLKGLLDPSLPLGLIRTCDTRRKTASGTMVA